MLPHLDPVALSIGNLQLRWYGLMYLAGFGLGWWLGRWRASRPGSGWRPADVDDLLTCVMIGIILGGRLGYVLFYDLASYIANPALVLRIWEGGMSFHGGLAGVIVAILLYARSRGLSALRILDYVAVVTPIGLLLGRFANFVNGELWGRPTNGSWGIIFPDAGPEPRHPSQLYEAATEGLLLLLLLGFLFWRTNARMKPGLLGGVFITGYGLSRFAIEFLREPDAQLGVLGIGLTMGQLLSLPMILFGLWLLATFNRREPAIA